jgi:hypothetical protein
MVKETFGCGTLLPGYGPLSFGEGLPMDTYMGAPGGGQGGGGSTGEDLAAAFKIDPQTPGLPPGYDDGPYHLPPGGPVFFQNISGGGATDFKWTFEGGATNTNGDPIDLIIDLENPDSVVYDHIGSWYVKLEISKEVDEVIISDTITRDDLIVVEAEVPPPIEGCMDPNANNYNPRATVSDGSCQYGPATQPGGGVTKVILGCTNPNATNYNPKATVDDGSCKYPPPPIEGCTNPNATNYNPRATVDDGSCQYGPVTQPGGEAILIDPGNGGGNGGGGKNPPFEYDIGEAATARGIGFDGALFGSQSGDSIIHRGETGGIPTQSKTPNVYQSPITKVYGKISDEVNLNNFPTQSRLLKEHPIGILDPVNFFKVRAPIASITPGIQKSNKYYDSTSNVLKKIVHQSINNILSKGTTFDSWSVGWTQDLTQPNIFESLNPSFLITLSKIKYSDGNYISDEDMYFLVKNRLIRDASVEEIDSTYFNYLSRASKNSLPRVVPSRNKALNEMYALKILEESSIALDYTKYTNLKHELLKNYYVLPTDIDAKVPIRLSDGTQSSLSVKDDNTFNCSTLPIVNPGYFIRLNTSSGRRHLPLTTQINRAYMYGSNYGAAAKKLLGGTGIKSIETSSPFDKGEFTKTLNLSATEAYEPVYFLSAVLSSVSSTYNSKSFLLKDTSAVYELMDTSSSQGVEDFNGLIRNITNCNYFYINHNDDMWPHILTSGKVKLTQEDISYFGPTDGNVPLYPRMFSPIIAIMPEGKLECNPLGVRSTIEDIIKDDKIVRKMNFIPSLDSKFFKDGINPFLNTITLATTVPTVSATDVFGNNDFDARITTYTPSKAAFTDNYRVDGVVTSVEPRRRRGSFTIIKNIIEELDDNYELTEDTTGKIIYKSDLFYRLAWREYSDIAYLDNWELIYKLLANGLFRDIRLIAPVKNTSQMSKNHTGLIRRKTTASSDIYDPIKADNNGLFLLPPNTLGVFPTPTGANPVGPVTRRNSRNR